MKKFINAAILLPLLLLTLSYVSPESIKTVQAAATDCNQPNACPANQDCYPKAPGPGVMCLDKGVSTGVCPLENSPCNRTLDMPERGTCCEKDTGGKPITLICELSNVGGSSTEGTCRTPDHLLHPSATSTPPPPAPPCSKWQNNDPSSGVCLGVATSLSSEAFSTDPAGFIARIFSILLSFAGGIALLLIISAGYKIMTSKGKPEAIQAARDQLIAAIVGLVFIIFSFVIFQLIFADILKIPGITH